MDIHFIVRRVAEGLVSVDSHTTVINANRRTRETYLPGVPNLTEPQFVKELMEWWANTHIDDFDEHENYALDYPYPKEKKASCDVVLRGHGYTGEIDPQEWALEFKYIRLVGNNGKNNDYGLAKALSPYLKDRSLIHDVRRFHASIIAQKKAVIMYGFDYDMASIERSRVICERIGVSPTSSANLRKVCRSVDPENLVYSLEPLHNILNDYLQKEALVNGDPSVALFSRADRHPCGGNGRIVGWQIV